LTVEKKTLKKSETFSPNLNECYEELRSQALEEPTAVVTPLGLALLLRKGTAAWLLAWYRPPEAPKAKEPLPEMICSELAMLLAEMLLNRRQKDEQFKKVLPSHLKRNAYLYIRQSTLRQVVENSESAKRQYALRQQAVALGWPLEQICLIDSDLGQSGASKDRSGFLKAGGGSKFGSGRDSAGSGGFTPGQKLYRLAPPAGNLCSYRYPHPG
jgi:hypothetical protein